GDSMVAGFIAGYQKTSTYEEALRLGAASGSATAFSSDIATRDFIDQLVKEIQVTKL
nr:1-phosphofructokinase [Turicibacter sp.]